MATHIAGVVVDRQAVDIVVVGSSQLVCLVVLAIDILEVGSLTATLVALLQRWGSRQYFRSQFDGMVLPFLN